MKRRKDREVLNQKVAKELEGEEGVFDHFEAEEDRLIKEDGKTSNKTSF